MRRVQYALIFAAAISLLVLGCCRSWPPAAPGACVDTSRETVGDFWGVNPNEPKCPAGEHSR